MWNRRTGHIVGGHQRLAQLDTLQGSSDYSLKVAEVDLSDSEEREANILLNNSEAQGQWDVEKLADMFAAGDVRTEATGFDAGEIMSLFGNDREDAIMATPGALDALAEKVRETNAKVREVSGISDKRDMPNYYVVIVAADGSKLIDWMKRVGLGDATEFDRYQSIDDMESMLDRARDGKIPARDGA